MISTKWISFLILPLCIGMLSLASCATSGDTRQITPDNPLIVDASPSQSSQTQQSPVPPASTNIVFTGSGSTKTAPFNIPWDNWIIEWSYTPGGIAPEAAAFSCFVMPSDGSVYVEWVMSSRASGDPTSNSTYSYAGSGQYYLDISSVNATG